MTQMTPDEARAFLRKKRRLSSEPKSFGSAEVFPLGHYQLRDGREMYGMNDLELRQAIKESERKLRQSEIALFLKLEAQRNRAGTESSKENPPEVSLPVNLQFDF